MRKIANCRLPIYSLTEVFVMGTFFAKCKVENIVDRARSAIMSKMLVDTGSEYTWIPATVLEKIGIQREKKDLTFVMANGQKITRSVGFAIIRLDKYFTVDEVVFAEKGDLLLLGARTLEGLNLSVDPSRKKLVASGPLPAAITKKY
jgi:predicted aspartyl protease